MAYYNLESDFVQMPPFEAFRDAESYYASMAEMRKARDDDARNRCQRGGPITVGWRW
jgi:antirestriction protein ArdC